MPQQESFFEQVSGEKRVQVVKTYDASYAHEVFRSLDQAALKTLAAALDINKNYDLADIPESNESEFADFLWDELLESSIEDIRLDPSLRSFFVVSQILRGKAEDLYISADLTSAKTFAQALLASSP